HPCGVRCSGRARVRPRVLILAALACAPAVAQELEPRAYSPAPVGTTFVLVGSGGSSGDILLDRSVHADGVEADLSFVSVGAGYTFRVLGHQARVLAVAPYAWGEITGTVGGQRARQDVSGFVDPRIKLSIGLRGAPALTPGEFTKTKRRAVVGASLTIAPPWGEYSPSQLVNLGYNRWAFKPEIGVSAPVGRWTLESYAGVWVYTDNHAYYPGEATRSQDPVASLQGHVAYTWKRGIWAALDGTWFSGGETKVDGAVSHDRQRNSRLGGTVSFPIAKGQSLKLSYSSGAATRRGSDFDTVNLTWQLVRF
ncbi:MAG TPA: transporter, partial [Candidatus Polarisedimenticolaceae bacterium]|nr:transporter [Candidatus Polarisedimenticolaceae bacterium]